MAPGLDRPLLAIPVLGNQVDAAGGPPPSWPVVPQPHVDQPVRLAGVGFEDPLADALELLALLVLIVRKAFTQFSEGGHQPRRLRECCLAALLVGP